MVSAARREQSIVPKRGWATSSWAIAGTTKATAGPRSATTSSQRPASKCGRYQPVIPLRIGPWTRSIPLVVGNGEEVRNPRPFQSGSGAEPSAGAWRTTTPFGVPVVPEV